MAYPMTKSSNLGQTNWRGFEGPSICMMCLQSKETLNHILVTVGKG
jgi:hypothetical protein